MEENILETIGSPLVRVPSPAGTTIGAKLESFNPGGSSKDRPAREMIRTAEAAGALQEGGTVVEATSGNTGIGAAIVCASRGYELIIVMPETKSPERRQLLRAYGATIELVDGDIQTAKARAEEIATERDAVELRQFENEANARSHYRTTAPEILDDLDGRPIDALVVTVGTGGTLTGVGRRLREVYPDLTIVAVEPAENPVLSTGKPGKDAFQGMGPGFVSELLDRSLIDRVETVTLERAEATCRDLARDHGILVGQSSGAAMIAATRVAELLADRSTTPAAGESPDPLVVTIFPDSGERYLSTGMFDDRD